jgi:hypothetical protein
MMLEKVYEAGYYRATAAMESEKNRKPLLLTGVRQCRKTYILNRFGENEFEDYAYFNFEKVLRWENCFPMTLMLTGSFRILEPLFLEERSCRGKPWLSSMRFRHVLRQLLR